ncbi:CBS domain-containing protein [Azohydromonas caseinilytica]|uniref:CBS domain-containing protein n=1 Tax=Azohydromonas caseinilytica TaxID=2728836 RepID=A0A848FIU0_9BURK|nr:CBS domain-containing protein [Azohydromonas caseinilytica]NML18199.1 CBS domain-containing protein [Azohydromonas caseinilytica]
MKIGDVCRHEVVSIDAHAPLREAAALMRSQHVGALVVTETGPQGMHQVIGVLSDRDLAIEVLARGADAAELKVGQLAQRRLAAIPADADVAAAATSMRKAGVRRLLVHAADGRLAGFVSSDDLLEAMAAQLGELAQALRAGIERERSERAVLARPASHPLFLNAGTPGMPWPGPVGPGPVDR